jgi:hypothetical protein
MALYTRYGRLEGFGCSAPVTVTDRVVDEALDWLQDPERPGRFTFTELKDRDTSIIFWFDDPDVAFEFKMRWA